MKSEDKALNLTIKCTDALRQVFGSKDDVPGGFRARARDLPTQLYYGGVTYTIAYIASKASSDKISGDELLMQALSNNDLNALFKEWRDKGLVKREAYELIGACLMSAIKELVGLSNIKNLTDVLKLLNDPGAQVLAERRLLEFAEWLKRLTEAVIQG